MEVYMVILRTPDGSDHYIKRVAMNYIRACRSAKNSLNAKGIKDTEIQVKKILNLTLMTGERV